MIVILRQVRRQPFGHPNHWFELVVQRPGRPGRRHVNGHDNLDLNLGPVWKGGWLVEHHDPVF